MTVHYASDRDDRRRRALGAAPARRLQHQRLRLARLPQAPRRAGGYLPPDFKFWTRESARRFAKAKDYPELAREAILEMHRQVGPLKFGPDGLARRGVLVRHLVMPGLVEAAAAIFQWLADALSPDTYVNIMSQYRSEYEVGSVADDGRKRYDEINRRPAPSELDEAHEAARRAGLWRLDERNRNGGLRHFLR